MKGQMNLLLIFIILFIIFAVVFFVMGPLGNLHEALWSTMP